MCLTTRLKSQFPHSEITKKTPKITEVCSYHPPVQFSLAKQILQTAVELCQDTSEVLIPTILFSCPLLRGKNQNHFKVITALNEQLYA